MFHGRSIEKVFGAQGMVHTIYEHSFQVTALTGQGIQSQDRRNCLGKHEKRKMKLPYFEELHQKTKDQKLKVILVSLDFKKQIEKKFVPFLKENKIASQVVLLLDSKEQEWIDKVDERWSGAIPITIVYRGKRRAFLEEDFASYTELEHFVNTIHKN